MLAVVFVVTAAAPAAAAPLPRVDARTEQRVRDEPKTPVRLTIDGRQFRGGIELRGQASQLLPKKPYGFETNRRTRLLGMPPERDWVLNAAYTDPSLMRDVLAHAAARRLGLAASRTRHVELSLNGSYRGVYVLMERPELSARRVRGDALLELTERPKLGSGDEWFESATGAPVVHVEPDEASAREARTARRAISDLEAALTAGDGGWGRHLDETSAVDYVLHAELFKNQDAFRSSTFLHLRRDGKLALGPVWDFDLSAGNTVEPALSAPGGWLLEDRPWAGRLLADHAFRVALAARWREVRASGMVKDLLGAADRHARALARPALRNFARWPTLGTPVFRHQRVHGSHAAAVAALQDWLVRRAAWMDGALAAAPAG